MVKKLTSFLQSKTEWKLSVRAAIAAAALGFLILAGVSFWPVLIFLFVLGMIYFRESAERKSLRISFWLTTFFAILAVSAIFHPISWVLIPIFGALIFTIFGIIHLYFHHRFVVFNILNTALAACFFLLVFYFRPDFSQGVTGTVLWFVLTFWVAKLLIKESLIFGEPLSKGRGLKLTSRIFGLLTVEIAVLCLFLPIGFINAAAFLTLLYILGRDVILARFRGFLTISLVLKELAILAVFASIIFALSGWSLP